MKVKILDPMDLDIQSTTKNINIRDNVIRLIIYSTEDF